MQNARPSRDHDRVYLLHEVQNKSESALRRVKNLLRVQHELARGFHSSSELRYLTCLGGGIKYGTNPPVDLKRSSEVQHQLDKRACASRYRAPQAAWSAI